MPAQKPPEFKFPMHDLHFKQTFRNLKMACTLALMAPLILYTLHNNPRKRKYRNFYSKYDPLDAFDRMMSGGYLASCPPGSGPKKDDKKDKKKK
ncbi:uncharacterized protein LOC122626469 [Drosophila teissieri]|uniref:uncharacterized protein LOC122626469 n=1 Tax=Drosophila teissieri TaxID=7243 RepID=UPI001CBA4575|nr:uncharacterized protein LOC122626469 [Drosophila teissieri]